MGSVFKTQTTRPVPAGAEVIVRKGQRLARWKDSNGTTRVILLTTGEDGSARIVETSPYYVAKFRDGAGVVRVVPTGCRDEQAARSVLARLERQAELVRSGVITSAEVAVGKHQSSPLADHFTAYIAYLEAKGACPEHRSERQRQLNTIASGCNFTRLADLDRGHLEAWLNQQVREGIDRKSTRLNSSHLGISYAVFC